MLFANISLDERQRLMADPYVREQPLFLQETAFLMQSFTAQELTAFSFLRMPLKGIRQLRQFGKSVIVADRRPRPPKSS